MSSIPDFLKGLSLKHAGFGGASELAGAYASATCGRERTATESVARATAAGSHPVVGMVDTAASLAEGAVCQGAKMEQQAADRARANGASAEQATLEGLLASPFIDEPGAKAGIALKVEQMKAANDPSKAQ